jgi:hypothetical protein
MAVKVLSKQSLTADKGLSSSLRGKEPARNQMLEQSARGRFGFFWLRSGSIGELSRASVLHVVAEYLFMAERLSALQEGPRSVEL